METDHLKALQQNLLAQLCALHCAQTVPCDHLLIHIAFHKTDHDLQLFRTGMTLKPCNRNDILLNLLEVDITEIHNNIG